MTSEAPQISIVTPSYNQAKFLEQAIQSVVYQGYPNLEYIVIDGGSSDRSVEILKQHDQHITYWVSQSDRGQSHAINKGFAASSGEIMGWLNSDDFLLPGCLKLVGSLFQAYPQINWLTGFTCVADENGTLTTIRPKPAYSQRLLRAGFYHGRGLGFVSQEATFWRRSLFDKSGGKLDETRNFSMDYDLWRRFAVHSNLVVVDTVLAAFRKQQTQKTSDMASYYSEAHIRVPNSIRLVTLPTRLALLGLTYIIHPRIVYSQKKRKWVYRRNLFGW